MKGPCHYCLGQKTIFILNDYKDCPVCKGSGVEEDLDSEFTYDRLFPDDRVPFNEEDFYSDDG